MSKYWVLLAFVSTTAMADVRYGSQCGLSDSIEDGQYNYDESKTLNISSKEYDGSNPILKANQLSKKNQIRVLITGRDQAARNSKEEAKKIKSTQLAIQYLDDGSEGGEAYIQTFTFKGKKFIEVISYPGGNPYGLIFPEKSTKPLASLNDGDLICK